MKTQAEYAKLSRQRKMEKNGYSLMQVFVNAKTKKRLEKLAAEYGVTQCEVLNFIEMK